MGKPKLEDYKTATAWLKAMDKHKVVKSNISSKPKAKGKKSLSSPQGVLETDYGFGKYTPKKHGKGRVAYEKYLQKQHLGSLTKKVAEDDAVLQADKYIGPRTNIKRAARSSEITRRIKKEADEYLKLGKPASETRTRYYADLNKERATYDLPALAEGELPKKYLRKKQAKGGYVKKYARGGGVRKVRR